MMPVFARASQISPRRAEKMMHFHAILRLIRNRANVIPEY
jgi:hypothetical protein